MRKFTIIAIFLSVFVLVLTGSLGILYSHSIYKKYMPSEIVYEIDLQENVWPDRFFVVSYSSTEFRSFQAEQYWTFEPGASPLSGNHWVYHPFAITEVDVSYTVTPVTR